MNPSIETATLQKLADGQLDHEQRCQVLAQLDRMPEGWRHLALMFVEQQILDQTAAALLDEPAVQTKPAQPVVKRRSAKLWQTRTWLAVATGWLLTLGGAFLVGVTSGENPWLPTSWQRGSSGGDVRSSSLADPGDGLANWFPSLGIDGQLDGPPDIDTWKAIASSQQVIPDSMRAGLLRSGYVVSEDSRFVSVKLQDGRQVSVPVHQVDVRFVGHQVYQ